ncbi:MAG: winged helix-turn-helix domain-containing protein [Chitinophagaceae bacterium]
MDVLEKFSKITALICEPVRAKILWSLLDGKAYTATELAAFANISITSASNHLSKLLDADFLKVETQGRHRYFTFSNADVAYAVEALAQLSDIGTTEDVIKNKSTGIKYCRTCYDHLAGFAGVQLTEAMEKKGYLKKDGKQYLVTKNGWTWLQLFEVKQSNYSNIRRPITRQCLDWSERRPHLAGQLGADLLQIMLKKQWFKKKQFSRELVVTAKGCREIYELFGVTLQ